MVFGLLLALLVVIAVLWLAPALLREHHLAELDRKQQNVSIAKERLDEIAAEHASGAMTDDLYEQSKAELEASLVDDIQQQQDGGISLASTDSKIYGRNALIAIVVLIPAGAIAMYQYLGSPQYIDFAGASAGSSSSSSHAAAGAPPATMEELITRLRERLASNPEDGEGWFLLAKSYMAQEDYAGALEAFEKTHEIIGDHPAILLGMADASAMLKDGNLIGKSSEYIDKALQIEPDNSTGLWLGGMASQQNGRFQQAVDRWSQLIPRLGNDPTALQQVQSLIDNAVAEASQNGIDVVVKQIESTAALPSINNPDSIAVKPAQNPETGSAGQAPAIKAWISIDASVQNRVSPDDVVFVFAKASSGPPMPLAAYKTTVSDLPMEVTLDDSMAMMPQMKLSAFEEVVVSARVSRSGQPRAMPGDISSELITVQLDGIVGVELNIVETVQ